MNYQATNNKRGYSLVEVMVAVTILMLAIAGPLTIAAKSLKSTQYAKNETIAYLLAQEGAEAFVAIRNEDIIRKIRNGTDVWRWRSEDDIAQCFDSSGCNIDFRDRNFLGNYSAQDSDNIIDCGNIADCVIYYDPTIADNMLRTPYGTAESPSASAEPTIYTRVVKAEEINSDEIKVVSTVFWESNLFGSEESVSVVTHVFKLYDNI